MTPLTTLPDERHSAILRLLIDDGRVLAGDLARYFGTSEDTIRRDLRDLAAAGLCRRVYGGALPLSPAAVPLRERQAEAPDAKAALGRAVAALVRPGETLLIDAGSTNTYVARALSADLGLTVITNAPAVAAALSGRSGFDLIVIGGRVDPQTGGSFGPRAWSEVAEIRPDLLVVGACAVSAGGLSSFDPEEAAFKRLLWRRARRRIAAVISARLGTAAPFGFADLGELDTLVVDADAPAGSVADLGLPAGRILRAAAMGDRP